MESNSRENSPDLGRKKSRRKPTVTRKITEENDKVDPEADTSFDYLQAVEENNKEETKDDVEEQMINGESNGAAIKDDQEKSPPRNGNNKDDFIIPEGTVIVEPEAVEDTNKEEYKGPEWKATKRLSRSAALGIIQCTACNKQINTNNTGAAKRHPVLKVLICKRCYSWYASAEIEQDSDGMDEQCRWCGDGGNLICCDYCHNAFCKSCIKKNLGRKELSEIVDADDKAKWHCYVCDPKPLASLIADCTGTLQNVDKEHHKVDDKRRDKKDDHAVVKGKSVGELQNRAVKTSQVAKKSTTPGKHSSSMENKIGQMKTKSAMTVATPSGQIVLPPGAIPVKTVINKAGNQVIVLQQPASAKNATNVVKSSHVKSKASDSQLQIISNAVKNVSLAMGKGKPQIAVVQKKPQTVKTVKSPVVRYEWDAPINEYNVGQALDRTLAVTESLRMVMVSLKDDMKKANSYPVQQCLEKKRIVAAKIRRAMGAFKKQVLDIEHFCKTTAKAVPQSQKQGQSRQDRSVHQKNKQPFPVSLLKSKRPADSKNSEKSKKDVEIIELSDSSDEESRQKSKAKKSTGEEEIPNKEKKNFQMKLRLGGNAESLGTTKRKRKHSADGNDSESEKENENHDEEANSPDEKKVPEKRKKKSGGSDADGNNSDDEPLMSRMSRNKSESLVKDKIPNDKSVEGSGMVDKDGAEVMNDAGGEVPVESESDSEVKQEGTGETAGKDKAEEEMVTTGDPGEHIEMDTEENEESTEDKAMADENEDVVTQGTEKEVGNNRPAGSESESDSEVKVSPAASDDQNSKDVEEKDANQNDHVESLKGENADDTSDSNHDLLLDNDEDSKSLNPNNDEDSKAINPDDNDEDSKGLNPDDNSEDSKGLTPDENSMDVDNSELRNSKLSSDGEKGHFEQLDGSKDTKKRKKKKAEEEQEGDTCFGGLKFQPLFDVESSSDVNGADKSVGKTPVRSGMRSRNDIEAQRELHKELLEDSSEEEDEDSTEARNEADPMSLDSSGSDSASHESNSDADYMPVADGKRNGKPSRKKTDRNQSKHNKGRKGDSSRKSRRFGEKAEHSKKVKSKSSKNTAADQSEDSDDEELNSSKQKKKSNGHKSTQNSKHSRYRKAKTVKEEDEDEEEESNSKRNVKKNEKHSKTRGQKVKEESEGNLDEEESKRNVKKTERDSKTKSRKVKEESRGEDSSNDEKYKKNKGKDFRKKGEKVQDGSEDEDDESSDQRKTAKNGKNSKNKKNDANERSEVSDLEICDKSTDYDSELEKDIERLAQTPQITSKKRKSKENEASNSDDDDEVDDRNTRKKSVKKRVKASQKKSRAERFDELSSGADSPVEEVDEEEGDLQAAGARALAALEDGLDILSDDEIIQDEDERARQDLLADDTPESSDSDVDEMIADKLDKKHSYKKKSEDTEDSDLEDIEEQGQTRSSDDDEEDSDEESEKKSKKSKFGKNQLLDAALSDSDEDFEIKKSKRTLGSSEDEIEEEEDNGGLSDVSSDFDIKPKKKVTKRKKKKSSSESDDDSDSEEKGKKGKKGKKKGRKRIKVASDSNAESNSAGSDDDDDTKAGKRKKIRKLIKDKKLSYDTKSAVKAEEERRKRIKERQRLYNQIDEEDVNSPTKTKITTRLVLEMDEKTKKPIIEVNKDLIRKLKPHQVEAVRFMWDCCIETVDRSQDEEGAGCILAHCMGLGKTLSVIAFIHTLMKNVELTNVRTCLIVCPLNTVLNWQRELGHWLEEDEQLLVDELTTVKDNHTRCNLLEDWQKSGGVMIMGYEMYRNLSTLRNIKKAKLKKIIAASLVDPGPDVVVCDEGHILKNDASALSKSMSQIKTKRRIALTGTPLQNNLVEYHCMVDFVKPKLLGTRKEFMNRFVNPIKNGQCSDSSPHDVKLMKKRAHILHEKLAGCVQRRDYSALTKFLPPKHEYVISVRLSEVQVELYQKYLNRVGCSVQEGEKIKGAKLFSDYQALMRIWTHPWVLKLQEIREEMKKMYDDTDEDSFIDNSDEDSLLDSERSSSSEQEDSVQEVSSDSDTGNKRRTRGTRANKDQQNVKKSGEVVKSWKTKSRGGGGDTDSVKTTGSTGSDKVVENGEEPVSTEWWAEHIKEEDKYNLEISGKIMLLSEVLRMAENIGDKVLVFSQSLLSLDLIEDFLNHWDTGEDSESQPTSSMGWSKGVDYFRMDGSTSAIHRKDFANIFNDPENVRARLFLISTKAGSLGTNLVGANRVIIFDASWNPSHDTQSIFRVYRFGQTKPVYIYRFLAQGTMEEKIYERQVTKQSLSQRVVDEHQVERHFSNADLTELYIFTPDKYSENKDYIPVLPKDMMLADLLTEKKEWIVKYHEHDSLLENKIEEDLTEEERKAAWEEFELEKKHGFRPVNRTMMMPAPGQAYNYNNINTQYARGATGASYAPPPQFSVQEIEQLAKAIYAANPGINQMDLQMRVQSYVTQQQQLYQVRQREQMMHEMARLRHLQEERKQQEQALQAAYSRAQTQGTSASSSASSLLRNLVATGKTSEQDITVVDVRGPNQNMTTTLPQNKPDNKRQKNDTKTNTGKKKL